ncbi:MAG TPA: BtrH N-terminal domain-containing protein [Steroidobacteraceae bacterium]|nr:BtrH N-terminal domain-containing protein [Steroidobacteraceae bacterium]
MTHFEHRQSAHCESGVMASMLTHYGLPMSEPMAFGLSGALAFAYIPFVKVGGMPLIGYRMPPGSIIRGLRKRLGLTMVRERFRNPDAGMSQLDAALQQGRPVGLQTSVYWLPYFPPDMRFHFNAHNLIVFGRTSEGYQISDPVFEEPVECPREDLQKARFAKGLFAAKGLLYYPAHVPSNIDLGGAIKKAIRSNHRLMAKAPLPLFGIRGIRYLASDLAKRGREGTKSSHLKMFLAHIVRMQEEIGTGGAGFRFLYASFLQEASQHVQTSLLQQASEQLTQAGDEWRTFASRAAKMCRNHEPMNTGELATILNRCADQEAAVWKVLAEV